MRATLVCIVEGHGEVKALPVLIRRIAEEQGVYDLDVPRPIRCPRSKVLRKHGQVWADKLARPIQLAANKLATRESGAVLILFDADEGCPATIAPELLKAAREARADLTCVAVLAKREYEAWFLAAIPSLKQAGKLSLDAREPDDPESVSDAKGYLSRLMGPNGSYGETVDQPAFSSLMDLAEAKRAPSFAKLHREVVGLLDRLTHNGDEQAKLSDG